MVVTVRIARIIVAKVSSMTSFARVIFFGGLLYSRTLSMFPTVWCILSQIALDSGILAVDWGSFKSPNTWHIFLIFDQ